MTFRFARPTTHDRLPTVESGMLLRHVKLSVVVPEATVNLVTNPSIEIDTTGYTASNSAIARVGTQARRGSSSLQVTPTTNINGGVFYTITLASGSTPYTWSLDVKGKAGIKYQIYVADTSGNHITTDIVFTATGQWQRVKTSWTESGTVTRRLYVIKTNSTSVIPFYVDGMQVEAKAYATTYCDGDQKNTVPQYPQAYQWQGAFQASQSLRRAEARHGGKVVSFADIGFQVSGLIGFGMNAPQNVASPFGLSDGALFQRTLYNEKTITIAGAFHARSVTEMERMRSELYDYLSRDKSPYQQPIRLFLQLLNNRGDAITDPTEFYAVYAGGLEQTVANPYQENVSIKLQLYNPFLFDDFDTAYNMTGPSVISSVYLAKSDGPGHTTQLTQISGGGATINAIVYNRFDGKLYVGGDFSSPASRIFTVDLKDNTVAAVGTGANGTINTIVVDDSGRVGIGGSFSSVGGVACNNLAYWNGSVWAAMGTGTNGEVKTIIKDTSGQFIVGGAFTTFNGTAAQNLGVMVAFGSGMLGYATGANSTVYALALDSTGTILYAGGDFTTFRNALANNRIVKCTYQPATQNIVAPAANVMGGAGANSTVRRLTFDHVGILYIGGAFTSICGVTTSFLAAWNGTSMSAVNNGTIPLVSMVSPMTVDSANNVYIEGFLWNGTSFTYPPGPRDTPLYIDPYDTRYLVIGAGDNYGAVNTITYTGTAIAYPKFHIVNNLAFSANDLVIVNATTRKYFYLSSIGAHVGIWVDIFIDFDPDTFSIVTADGRALDGSVLPQSQAADMYLVPGQNEILVIWTNSSYNADTVTMTVKNAYQSISDVVR
jgi:hypothetical protein